MARRSGAKTPRNTPRQPRSRATVEAILDATIRILEQESWDTIGTTRIAEVAGVSVGTLYQYFSCREEVLNALQDREFERAAKMMERVLEDPKVSNVTVARSVIVELLRLYRAAPGLHRVLAVEGLRIVPTERVQAFDARIIAAIKGFLTFAGSKIRRGNLDAAAFVVYQSVRAAMLAYLLEQPPAVNDEILTEELTDLVLRYLGADDERP